MIWHNIYLVACSFAVNHIYGHQKYITFPTWESLFFCHKNQFADYNCPSRPQFLGTVLFWTLFSRQVLLPVSKEPNLTRAQEVPALTGSSPAAAQAELGAGTGSSPSHREGGHKAALWCTQRGNKLIEDKAQNKARDKPEGQLRTHIQTTNKTRTNTPNKHTYTRTRRVIS